jgi:hypothetical protein
MLTRITPLSVFLAFCFDLTSTPVLTGAGMLTADSPPLLFFIYFAGGLIGAGVVALVVTQPFGSLALISADESICLPL